MEIKITNAEAINLFNALSNLNVVGNAKFVYAIAKTKQMLKPHIDALQEASQSFEKDHPEFRDFKDKLDALLVNYARDAEGKPVTRMSADGQQLIRMIPQDKQAAYVEARQLLEKEYEGVLKAAQLHGDEFASLLKEEVTFKVHGIHQKDLPDNTINTQIMNLIFVLVIDEEEEEKSKK